MRLPTERSLGILGLAALLGVLGDALLRATPWGVNLPLWMGVAAAAGWALVPDRPNGRSPITGWPLLAVMFFALCFAWRDSSFLRFWNGVAILGALSLPALQMHGVQLRLARITDYAMGLAASGVNAVAGVLMLTPDDVPWHVMSRHGRQARAAAVGVALAVPVLLVFGGLLMSADPGFERMVQSLVDWAFSTIASHVLLAGFIAWTSAGYLRTLATARDPVLKLGNAALAKAPSKPALGLLELGIPLGALSVIFLVFVGLQARYLFGGEAVILETAGLTYAEYARGGFFELVTASTLLLPVLLGTEWLLDKSNMRNVMRFRALSATLLVLIGLMMMSAVQRMRLYIDAYGLTQDRFYAMAFMIWIGVVLALYGATVLRGMRNRFAFGAVTTGFATLAILNIMNPEAVIVRTNLARAEAGAELDLEYAARLHADAIPELMARAPALLPEDQCDVFRQAIDRWTQREAADWRSWNLSRAKARRAVLRAGPPRCGAS
ncbi:MAG: DUF4173 domain-containing protein [Gemmatimonadetes bacterium]|nr:DUF4173 domain-containing protein [Gemmatimonadota bacterium]